jgi:thiol:disulfide interchange protein DsbD
MRIVFLLAASVAVTAAVPVLAQEERPVEWGYQSPAITGAASPGALIRVRLAAKIREGWHLYSLRKMEGGPIATRISLEAGQPFSLDGEIEASAPIRQHDPVFDMEVEYYSDSAEFTLPVRVASDARAGKQPLKVSARFQSCDERQCLPPRTVTIETQVDVQRP